MYRKIKEGTNSPVANICCWNCGERYISIDENCAEFGRCLNYNEMNELNECGKCESYCDELYDVVGFEVCEKCYNEFRCE